MSHNLLLSRRRSMQLLLGAGAAWVGAPRTAHAFGDEDGFDPRPLLAGGLTEAALSAANRWSLELVQRTSAPARLRSAPVRADDPALLAGSFAFWSAPRPGAPWTAAELGNLRRFFALGGTLVVDDPAPGAGGAPSPFAQYAKRELQRVLPDSLAIPLPLDHVIYRTFYLLRRAVGRVEGAATASGFVRSGRAQVIFLENDLAGALSRSAVGNWEQTVLPGGERQREMAIRFAVNLAMYALCSNYKDDQVHAKVLMRRRTLLSD